MPILCFQPNPSHSQRVPQSLQAEEVQVQVEPCHLHKKPIEFVCSQPDCERDNNLLLCKQCLKDHRSHQWTLRQQYFSVSMRNILDSNPAPTAESHLEAMKQKIKVAIEKEILDLVKRQVEDVLQSLQDSCEEIENRGETRRQREPTRKVSRQALPQLKQLYEQEKKEIGRIRSVTDTITQSITLVSKGIAALLKPLHLQTNLRRWEDEKEMESLKEQIAKFSTEPQARGAENYFAFSPILKHENIRLQEKDSQAVYMHSVPSKPAAIATRPISDSRNFIGFEIVRMQSMVLFFQCTTIFVGVCNPDTVKVAGHRKINESSKGSYLISSAGWSYHHRDPQYDRKDNVGWTFGQGDHIEIQVKFDPREHRDEGQNPQTSIIFRKKGRFFDSKFEMPLKLTNDKLRKLRPCVSFCAEEGAVVRIYDIVQ